MIGNAILLVARTVMTDLGDVVVLSVTITRKHAHGEISVNYPHLLFGHKSDVLGPTMLYTFGEIR